MEEKILEILRKCNYPDGEQDDDVMCANEITAYITEFIEWFHIECGGQTYLQIDDEPRRYLRRFMSVHYPIDYLFKYWINQIKTK